jgi:biopolymer transport protein ExbB
VWWRVLGLVVGTIGCGRIGFDPLGAQTGSAQTLILRLDLVDPHETLTDFPLPVVLDDQRAPRDLLDPTASNLRFLDPSSGAVLPDEIEQVGTPGGAPLIAWVRVPQIVGLATEIELAIGDGVPPPSTDSVWSASYEAVYHMTNGATDATANHHDGAAYGGTPLPMAGRIASAQAFSSGACYTIADAASLDLPELTVSGWIWVSTAPAAYASIIGRSVSDSNYDDFWLGLHGAKQRVEVAVAPTDDIGFDASAVATGSWIHVALTADGNKLTPYVDGVAGTAKPTGAAVEHDPMPIVIAADEESSDVPNANYLDGAADEIRIEHGVRDASWLGYDDAAQRDMVIDY